MPVTDTLARDVFLLAGFRWDHDHASVFDATLGNDVVGEMLNLRTGAAQRGHLHAVIIVEMNMKRGQRQIVMAMIIFDQVVPGLIITQHSGDGKANQYFLRGFNLDHGTDLAISVDDMPVNMRTHAHGQGYADLNFLIPELIGSVNIRKGPYFADEGDFSSVGSVHVGLLDNVNKTMASITAGSFGYRRILGITSTKLADGTLLIAGEANTYNGPWDNPDSLRKLNGVMR
jgi:hypothetical protein